MVSRAAMLLLKLTTLLPFLSLDAFTLVLGKHFLVFHAQLATLDIEAIHAVDDELGVGSALEVGECESTEDTLIKVVVKRVWLGQMHLDHDGCEVLLADVERDVFDDDGGGDEIVDVFARVGHGTHLGRPIGLEVDTRCLHVEGVG